MENKIILKDQIYGNFEIEEPVIIELINSKPLQRLKNISQFGIPDRYYYVDNFSRFEHSIGVMLLLRSLKAPKESQIAGLVHDVSHTVFSHVIDWVIGEKKEESYHEKRHKEYLENSRILEILEKYDYSSKKIANLKNFPLLERDIPDLCADRIDYAIREFPLKISKKILEDLTVKDNKIVFKNKESALIFADNFLDRQINHWGGFEAVSRYHLFSKALKMALNKEIIEYKDFEKNENFIIEGLENSENKEIKKILKILKKDSLNHLPKSNKIEHKKFRHVDPLFISGDGLERLSGVDDDFHSRLERVHKINKKGVKLPEISL